MRIQRSTWTTGVMTVALAELGWYQGGISSFVFSKRGGRPPCDWNQSFRDWGWFPKRVLAHQRTRGGCEGRAHPWGRGMMIKAGRLDSEGLLLRKEAGEDCWAVLGVLGVGNARPSG